MLCHGSAVPGFLGIGLVLGQPPGQSFCFRPIVLTLGPAWVASVSLNQDAEGLKDPLSTRVKDSGRRVFLRWPLSWNPPGYFSMAALCSIETLL